MGGGYSQRFIAGCVVVSRELRSDVEFRLDQRSFSLHAGECTLANPNCRKSHSKAHLKTS